MNISKINPKQPIFVYKCLLNIPDCVALILRHVKTLSLSLAKDLGERFISADY